ncbi:MAG: DUF3352 domain-containing protein, partial [Gaiellaceae bacterium]
VVSACGGSESSTSNLAGIGEGGSTPPAADLLPADVPVLVTLNTDLNSEQWQLASAIVDKFPASQELIDTALMDLAGEGLDFETDIRPALGPDATIAVLEVSGDDPPVALVLKPADAAQLESLLMRNQDEDPDNAPVWRVVDESYVLADDEATLDTLLAGAEQASLADEARFKSVMESLPGDSLARVWVSPTVTDEIVAQAAAENPTGLEALESLAGVGQGTFEGAGVALLAAEEGVRFVGVSKTADAPTTGSGNTDILGLAPAGALAYVSLHDLRQSIEQIIDLALAEQPDAEQQIAQAEALLRLTIEDDLLPLFENEHAVYVRPGVSIPEVTVVLSPDDPGAAVDLVKQFGALAAIGGLDLQGDTVDVGGTSVERLGFNGVTLYIGSVEGRVVITTAEAGIADFGGADSLGEDPRFADLAAAAGLPDETAGFAYVDIAGIVELVTLGGLLGAVGGNDIDPEALRNLDPLGAAIVYGTSSADEQQFAGLLTIE